MQIPRIEWHRSSPFFDGIAAHWTTRYGAAVAAVVLSAMVSVLFGERLGVEFYLLLLFATVLVVSVLGGLGPGLLATVLVAVLGYEAPRRRLSLNELELLMIEGVIVSIGGTLRAGVIRARERLKTDQKVEQHILEITEIERLSIGHDLHDGLGQHLTGISLLSEAMAQQLAAGGKPRPADLETITRLVGEAIRITRDLAKSLSPITLEVDGLPTALMELAETSSSLLGVHCTCEYAGQDLELDATRSLHLFRIVQEAVNNSVRHGKARNVRIGLIRDDKVLKVTVTDDGVGLSLNTSRQPGLGLRIMQRRARMLGAVLTAERATAEGGTVVTCIAPLDGDVPRS